MEAVVNGTDSAFDSPAWLYFPPPVLSTECPVYSTAYKVIMQQIVRIPRLIRLVRELRQDPNNVQKGVDAIALAEKLYLTRIDKIIDGAVHNYADRVPTRNIELGVYYPESFNFATVSVFETLTRYCYCRILIIGLCRTICSILPISAVLNAAPLQLEELHMAELIAMSTQYAEGLFDPFPLGALLIILPLQVAFGAWWRAQRDKDLLGESDPEMEKVCFMKEWCKIKSNEMLLVWNGMQLESTMLEIQAGALEGGAIMDWMRRKITPL